MKNKILAFVLVLTMIITSASIVASAAGYDAPLAGGRTQWSADDIMYPGDEGTKYHGAFVQPDVWNPIDGKYEHWTGCLFERTTYNGVECVKVSIDPEGTTLVPMMDFNYYQWNAEYYMPSLDATKNCWLKIKYAYNDAADAVSNIKFHASKDVTPLGASSVLKNAYKTFDIVNGAGAWQEVVVNLSDMIFEDGTAWNENTIRQFRLQMFEGNENPDAACYIAGFGFFETEDAAKAWDCAPAGNTSAADKAAAEAAAEAAAKAEAEKKAAEEAAAKAEAEKKAAEEAAAKAAEEAAAKAAEAAAAEEAAKAAAEAAAADDADEATKAAAEEAAAKAAAAKAEAEAAEAAAKAEAEAAEAAAKAATDTANAAAEAATTASAAQTSDYTVVAIIAAVIALGALAVSKKRFSL